MPGMKKFVQRLSKEAGVTYLQLVVFMAMTNMAMSQPTAAWVFTYNGEGDYSDRYTCITGDASGNIYVAGSTVNIGTDRDFLVQKLDASGNEIWRQEYNAAGNGPDEVTAIVVDGSSNVYVTGFGKSEDAGNDYLTIKMNGDGNILWAQVYNYDAANQYDQPNSMALDGNGNVIVTGQSDQDETASNNDDYLTVKYSNDGAIQWTARYNGVGNGIDRAVKVVTDASNNIYVTGRSFNGDDDDYATIKYDANGVQQWLKLGDRTHNDRAQAMVIDGSANIYVTGRSSNGTNNDFYTIKYNSSGTQSWAKVYDYVDDDQSTALFVDGNGNVFVTGQSDGDATPFTNYNIRTVKYNSSGVQQWSIAYDGAAGNDDLPVAVSVNAGNVYVTGYSDADATPVISNDIVTIKYSSGGTQTWAQVFSGAGGNDDVSNAMMLDASAHVFVAGYESDSHSQRNALLIDYDTDGNQQFTAYYNGVGDNSDNIRQIVSDSQGNLYVAGYAVQRGQNRDFFSIKLTAQGDTLWTNYINGSSPDAEDEAIACEVYPGDYLITAGFTKNSGTSGDFTLERIDAGTGDSVWTRYYDSPTHENDKAYDMHTDAAGNIYVTGRTDSDPSINSNDDATTVKFDGDGNLLWSQSYAGAGNGPDRGSVLKISVVGNIYVAGRTFNGTDNDMLLIKYNAAGVQQWVKTFSGGAGNDVVNDMVVDANENAYLIGNSASAGDTSDLLILKYDAAGSLQWNQRINNGGGDFGERVVLDGSGNVIALGYTDADNSAAINFNTVTAKYDASGSEKWMQTFDGTAGLDDIADAITTDQFGNSYVALHSNEGSASNINYNVIIVRYNADGTKAWQVSYAGPSDTLDVINTLLLDNNDLLVAGSTWINGDQRDMLVIRYGNVTGVNEISSPDDIVSVYPNPVATELTVRTVSAGEKIIQLFDAEGKQVYASSFNGNEFHLSLNKQLFMPGLYLCRIVSNHNIISNTKIFYQP